MDDQIKKNRNNYKRKKIKKLYKIVKKVIKFIGTIGTVFSVVSGVSIWGAINMVSKKIDTNKTEGTNALWFVLRPCVDFIINHFSILIAISFLIALIVNLKIIPKREIDEGKPPEEAKPPFLKISFLFTGSCTSLIICFLCVIYAMDTTENSPHIKIEPIPEIEESEKFDTINLPILSEEKLKIDYYIERCCAEVIPIEELEKFSNSELKYTRNGIYAHEGYYFSSGYFNDFTWYNGNILPENFTDEMLSDTQMTNILNIRQIEKERGIY